VEIAGGRNLAVEDCTVRHVGGYGIWVRDGSDAVRLVGNHLDDLGAGGVRIDGADAHGPAACRTAHVRVTDNVIHAGGRVFPAGIAVLCMHASDNVIAHNEIYDFYYTGVSVGWVWGYGENVSKNNLITKNHIHDIGQGRLSDMGGVYTLGIQPGTVIAGNLIHDIRKKQYGGWAVYLDEGSSNITVENNICYDTDSAVFHTHYGRDNTVRNNIFAFGGEGAITLGRAEGHVAFTLERNILVTLGQPIFHPGYKAAPEDRAYRSDGNLLWDAAGSEPAGAAMDANRGGRKYTLADLRALGYDLHSVVADPKFRNCRARDFTLAPDSPALKMGFVPIDVSDAGPRPKDQRD
jgi:parallel beta-helix repeat protein